MTVPVSAFSPSVGGPSRIFSGRTPIATSPVRPASGTRSSPPASIRTRSGAGDGADEQVRDAEEAGDELRARPLVELGRRAELLDLAAVHDRDRVGHRHRLLLVVRDVDEGDPQLVLDALQLELELLAQLQVERAERLVEQQHLRPVDERPRERDPLLLAAGQLARLARRRSSSSPTRRRISAYTRLLQLGALDPLSPQPERDVLVDRQVREEGVALEDGVDVALVAAAGRRRPCRRAGSTPSSGSSKPPIIRSVVVLPHPDGPSSAKNEPAGISSEMPFDGDDVVERLTTDSSRTSLADDIASPPP